MVFVVFFEDNHKLLQTNELGEKKNHKIGRPRLDDGARPMVQIWGLISPEMLADVHAARGGQPVAAWVREAIAEKLRRGA